MPTGAVGGRGNHVMNHKQSETIIQTLKTMKLQVQMVAMSHLSDVQELIRFGALEQVRRELNFVKSLMLEYPDLEAEVPEERINEIYARNMADLAKPAGQMMNGAASDKWLYEPIGRRVRRIVLPAVVMFAIAALSLRRL